MGFVRSDSKVDVAAMLGESEDIVMRVYYLFSLDDIGSPQMELEKNIDIEI